jgi:hypothetical protein
MSSTPCMLHVPLLSLLDLSPPPTIIHPTINAELVASLTAQARSTVMISILLKIYVDWRATTSAKWPLAHTIPTGVSNCVVVFGQIKNTHKPNMTIKLPGFVSQWQRASLLHERLQIRARPYSRNIFFT